MLLSEASSEDQQRGAPLETANPLSVVGFSVAETVPTSLPGDNNLDAQQISIAKNLTDIFAVASAIDMLDDQVVPSFSSMPLGTLSSATPLKISSPPSALRATRSSTASRTSTAQPLMHVLSPASSAFSSAPNVQSLDPNRETHTDDDLGFQISATDDDVSQNIPARKQEIVSQTMLHPLPAVTVRSSFRANASPLGSINASLPRVTAPVSSTPRAGLMFTSPHDRTLAESLVLLSQQITAGLGTVSPQRLYNGVSSEASPALRAPPPVPLSSSSLTELVNSIAAASAAAASHRSVSLQSPASPYPQNSHSQTQTQTQTLSPDYARLHAERQPARAKEAEALIAAAAAAASSSSVSASVTSAHTAFSFAAMRGAAACTLSTAGAGAGAGAGVDVGVGAGVGAIAKSPATGPSTPLLHSLPAGLYLDSSSQAVFSPPRHQHSHKLSDRTSLTRTVRKILNAPTFATSPVDGYLGGIGAVGRGGGSVATLEENATLRQFSANHSHTVLHAPHHTFGTPVRVHHAIPHLSSPATSSLSVTNSILSPPPIGVSSSSASSSFSSFSNLPPSSSSSSSALKAATTAASSPSTSLLAGPAARTVSTSHSSKPVLATKSPSTTVLTSHPSSASQMRASPSVMRDEERQIEDLSQRIDDTQRTIFTVERLLQERVDRAVDLSVQTKLEQLMSRVLPDGTTMSQSPARTLGSGPVAGAISTPPLATPSITGANAVAAAPGAERVQTPFSPIVLRHESFDEDDAGDAAAIEGGPSGEQSTVRFRIGSRGGARTSLSPIRDLSSPFKAAAVEAAAQVEPRHKFAVSSPFAVVTPNPQRQHGSPTPRSVRQETNQSGKITEASNLAVKPHDTATQGRVAPETDVSARVSFAQQAATSVSAVDTSKAKTYSKTIHAPSVPAAGYTLASPRQDQQQQQQQEIPLDHTASSPRSTLASVASSSAKATRSRVLRRVIIATSKLPQTQGQQPSTAQVLPAPRSKSGSSSQQGPSAEPDLPDLPQATVPPSPASSAIHPFLEHNGMGMTIEEAMAHADAVDAAARAASVQSVNSQLQSTLSSRSVFTTTASTSASMPGEPSLLKSTTTTPMLSSASSLSSSLSRWQVVLLVIVFLVCAVGMTDLAALLPALFNNKSRR